MKSTSPPADKFTASQPQQVFQASTISEWMELVKIEHTVFALPFALSGLVLASAFLPGVSVVFWTILAFTGARAAAMTLNRLIDADMDARNPRTASRAIPDGRISKRSAVVFAAAAFGIMLYAASHLPSICLYLAPIAIFWLSFYSYTKRFTWACHLALGIALAGAALGGWIAAGGSLSVCYPWLLALAVGTWVAGFDIIYACQDIGFDQQARVFSAPARFGLSGALLLSQLLHVVTVIALMALGLTMSLGLIYWAGVLFVTGMLVFEHSLVKPDDLSKVNAAFFTTNGFVSIAAFLAIFLDRYF